MQPAGRLLIRVLIDSSRWLFLFVLAWAPWAYGSTRDWTLPVFNWLLAGVAGLWVAGLLARRERPVVHPLLLVTALFLIAQGWFMIWNAPYYYDRGALEFVAVPNFWKSGPGALDTADAIPMMARITGLLVVMCFVCDLSRRPVWRRRIWVTVGVVAVSLIAFGLGRKVLGLELMSEDAGPRGEPFKTSFALYLYRGNAAAFINLVLPLVAGLASAAFSRFGTPLGRATWPAAVLLCIAGATVTASKIGMVITAAILLILAAWEIRRLFRRHTISLMQTAASALLAVLIIVSAVAFGWHRAKLELARLPELASEDTFQDRVLAAEVCLRMMPDAGLWGMGPGNFAVAFPHYTEYLGDRLLGVWQFAHMDYMQTAVEWGWIGAAIWSIILFGGIIVGFVTYARRKDLPRPDSTLLFTATIAVLGVAAHAAVDFPLQIASLQLYTATYLGLAWGAGSWLTPKLRATAAGENRGRTERR